MAEGQGKKVAPPPLRLRRSRRSRPSARSSHREAVWPRAEQHAREKTWQALVAAHKRPGFPGGKEEAMARRSDGLQPTRTTALATPQFIDPADR
jgi:hypothetical protein